MCSKCPVGVHSFENSHEIDRSRCILCGSCIDICPANALSFTTRILDEDEFLGVVKKQKELYGNDGGITFSGGEPLLQAEKLLYATELAGDIHKAIETCGYADSEIFKKVIDGFDYIMFDVKLADSTLHKKYTGVSNELILRNLEILKKSGKEFIIRTPLIPGITDTEDNISSIKQLIGDYPHELLPYNNLAPSKYEKLGKKYFLEK